MGVGCQPNREEVKCPKSRDWEKGGGERERERERESLGCWLPRASRCCCRCIGRTGRRLFDCNCRRALARALRPLRRSLTPPPSFLHPRFSWQARWAALASAAAALVLRLLQWRAIVAAINLISQQRGGAAVLLLICSLFSPSSPSSPPPVSLAPSCSCHTHSRAA